MCPPLCLSSVLALCVAALACPSGDAQAAEPAESRADIPVAWASLTIEPGQRTQLQLTSQTRDPAIAAALERIAGRPPETSEYAETWVQWTAELPAASRHRLALRQDLALEPLLEVLDAAGQPTLVLVVRHPRAGSVTLEGASVVLKQPGYLSASVPTGAPRRPLRIELGWNRTDVMRTVVVLLLALVGPLAVGFAVRARSIARDRVPQAWFGRAQAINVVVIVGWILWMAAVETTKADDLMELALSGGNGYRMIAAPLWLLAFLPTAIALTAMVRGIGRRLRGFDPLPRGGRLLGQMRLLVPLALVLVAIPAFGAGDPRAGVFALLGAVVAGFLLPGARGPMGGTPQALSSGALRDRLFEFAHRSGVRLRELYVVPMRRERMANAFAVSNGVVMVGDELLDRMSRREVDAVLAHEISHLEHQHPVRIMLAAMGACVPVTVVAMTLQLPCAVPAGFVAAWLSYLFVARRCEFSADAGAAALTGDAEALISGLGRLARLNDMPLAWGRGWGWLVTHPTTEARCLVAGRRAGLAPERVRELLANDLPPAERYGQAERPGEEGRVFSTAWKTTTVGRLTLAMLAVAVLAPAAAMALSRALGFVPPHAAAILAGAVIGAGAVVLVHDWLAARPVAMLEAALRRRLGDRTGDAVSFVALSPGDRARVYEGFLDWDLGLLSLEPDRLSYRGEQIALELPRQSVSAIEVGAETPGWIRVPRAIVRWSTPAGEEALTLRLADARRVSAIGPASRALVARLRQWREAGGAVGQHDVGGSPPAMGPVTSRTPADAAALRDLPALVVLIGILSAGAAFLLGFDLWRGIDVFAAGLLALLAVRWPAMVSRERPPKAAAESTPERRAA
jgi:Zn-dependent protease with chaperone function